MIYSSAALCLYVWKLQVRSLYQRKGKYNLNVLAFPGLKHSLQIYFADTSAEQSLKGSPMDTAKRTWA